MDRGIKTILARYESRLSELARQVGDRNRRLLGIANLGVLAGLSPDRIESDIITASGNPPLSTQEVRHAVRRALQDTSPLPDIGDAPRAIVRRPPPPPPPLGRGAVDFVERTLAAGRNAPDLAESSPIRIPLPPADQTRVFLTTLYTPGEILFIGGPMMQGVIGHTIRTRIAWTNEERVNGPMLIANPLTGQTGMTGEGKPSLRCAASVAARRFALVEFDAMTLQDQYDFWRGAILRRVLPVVSVTFSGSKSLHGLLRIDASDSVAWTSAMSTLLYAVANPKAPPERMADRACRNPDRLTRLPGAIRDNGEVQALLWLAAPDKMLL